MGKIYWDDEENCFKVNGQSVYLNDLKGWSCYCEDRAYNEKPNIICKHLAAMVIYMAELEAEDLIQ